MKKTMLVCLLCIAYSFTAAAQERISIDTEKSIINWLGSKLMGFSNHYGTVKFLDGTLVKTKDKITGGTFIVDMNTIANIDGGYNEGLVDHLKNDHFFDVFNHPTAILVMTEVHYTDATHIDVKAELTIKDITKPIAFKGVLDFERKEMITSFVIDRTNWEIMYGTANETDVRDYVISNDIEFKVQVKI